MIDYVPPMRSSQFGKIKKSSNFGSNNQSGFITPSISNPANQTIFTNGVANNITVSGVSYANIEANGVSIGAASPTLAWTPTAVNYSVSLTAANAAGKFSSGVSVVVAEANHINTDLTTWTGTNIGSVTGGEPDPDGGNNAYKVTMNNSLGVSQTHKLNKANTIGSGTNNNGQEIWLEYNASLPCVKFEDAVATRFCYLDLNTGQTAGNFSYCKIVETRGNWKRIWFNVNANGLLNSMTFYPCTSIDPAVGASFASVGTEFVRAYNPRACDQSLPFTNYQKNKARFIGVSGGGLDQWRYHNNFASADNTDLLIEVLKPTAYSTLTKYPVCFVLEVEALPYTFGDSLAEIKAAGLHDTYNCIFVRSTFASVPWYGTKNDGTLAFETQVRDVLVGFIDEFYSTLATRDSRMLFGFSKGGWGAVSLLMKSPDVFGYAGTWDSPWDLKYGDFETVTDFGSAAQLALYNPYDIFNSTRGAIADKKRLAIGIGTLFQTADAKFDVFLTQHSVPHTYVASPGYAAMAHAWNSGWIPYVFSAMWLNRTT